MNKKIVKLKGLFSNTKFLIVFSIVVALIFWVVVALEFSPIVDQTIRDVPVTIDMNSSMLQKMGLQVFSTEEMKVDITVEGKRYIVGVLNPEDFEVVADTAYIDTAGDFELRLKVAPKDTNADYEIVKLSEDYVKVYFDKLVKDVKVPVVPVMDKHPQKLTEDGFSFDVENDIIVSEPTVSISGAKKEVEKIKKVYAHFDVSKSLSVSTTVDAVLSFDEDVKYVEFQGVSQNGDGEYFEPVTLCVYSSEKIKTDVDFVNAPSQEVIDGLKFTYNYNELTFDILQSKNGAVIPSEITVGNVDFRKISPTDSRVTFSADEISENIKNNPDIDNGIRFSGSVNAFSVYLDTSSLSSADFAVSDRNITFSDGDKEKYSFNPAELGKITVVGSKADVDKIKPEDIIAEVNTAETSVGKTASEVSVDVRLKDNDKCWIYGEYKLNVSLK